MDSKINVVDLTYDLLSPDKKVAYEGCELKRIFIANHYSLQFFHDATRSRMLT